MILALESLDDVVGRRGMGNGKVGREEGKVARESQISSDGESGRAMTTFRGGLDDAEGK